MKKLKTRVDGMHTIDLPDFSWWVDRVKGWYT